jgi:hypothetical protein
VEPWQEEEESHPHKLGAEFVPLARVCVVLATGVRLFYKYSKAQSFSEYAMQTPHDVKEVQMVPLGQQPKNDDLPCCFYNGRFVRVNRDSSRSAETA